MKFDQNSIEDEAWDMVGAAPRLIAGIVSIVAAIAVLIVAFG